MAPVIKYDFWLIFSANGSAPRCTKNSPALAVDERAMRCSVSLPKSVLVRPTLTATITVDEVESQPAHIDVQAAETALAEVLGAEVIVTVRPANEGNPA